MYVYNLLILHNQSTFGLLAKAMAIDRASLIHCITNKVIFLDTLGLIHLLIQPYQGIRLRVSVSLCPNFSHLHGWWFVLIQIGYNVLIVVRRGLSDVWIYRAYANAHVPNWKLKIGNRLYFLFSICVEQVTKTNRAFGRDLLSTCSIVRISNSMH